MDPTPQTRESLFALVCLIFLTEDKIINIWLVWVDVFCKQTHSYHSFHLYLQYIISYIQLFVKTYLQKIFYFTAMSNAGDAALSVCRRSGRNNRRTDNVSAGEKRLSFS